MRTLALSGLLFLAFAVAGCNDDPSTPPAPTPEPDRVVGIELKCDILYAGSTELKYQTFEGWDTCSEWRTPPSNSAYTKSNLRKDLTIRTASGDTYKVSYGAEHDVHLGDVWPPR